MWFLVLVLSAGYALAFDGYRNQSFLFISGMPQSGTSLLNNLVGAAPRLGTMEKKCEEVHGKACVNWNHEGQWMLPRIPVISDNFRPGKMCPLSPDAANIDELSEEVMSTWMKFWDMSSSDILVEKSPQSMLKISLYRSMLDQQLPSGGKMKALVVIKHPITLNSAIIGEGRDPNWATHSRSGTINRLASRDKKREIHSDQALLTNIWQFIRYMRGNTNSTSAACHEKGANLGWLQSVSLLMDQLKGLNIDVGKGARREVEVGILRYEYFLQPALACQAIFRFIIFDSPEEYKEAMADSEVDKGVLSGKIKMYNGALERACGGMGVAKSAITDKSPFEWGQMEKEQGKGRRKLRLRDSGTGGMVEGHTRLENALKARVGGSPLRTTTPVSAGAGGGDHAFSVKLVHRSIYTRIREFASLFKPSYYSALVQRIHANEPSGGGDIEGRPAKFASAAEEVSAIAVALNDIQSKLSPLGYSLSSPHFSRTPGLPQSSRLSSANSEDQLLPWDLVNNYG